MTPADLRALAERVEKGEKSSELNDAVCAAIGWVPQESPITGASWYNGNTGDLCDRLPDYLGDHAAVQAAWKIAELREWWLCGMSQHKYNGMYKGIAGHKKRAVVFNIYGGSTEHASQFALLLRCLAAEKEAAQ